MNTKYEQKARIMRKQTRDKLPHLMLGRIVFQGRYEITEEIGRGSWSVCYAAKSLHSPGDIIAVKCVPRQGLSSRDRISIKDEAICHRRMEGRHRNILRLVASEEHISSDILYIGSEL